MTDHHFMRQIDANCKDFAQDCPALPGQDFITNCIKAPETIGGISPPPHPTTAAAQLLTNPATNQLNDELGDTFIRTQHTSNTATCLRHANFPARITVKTIPWTKVDLLWDTVPILPADHSHQRHQNCIHKPQLLNNLTTRRRSPFRIYSQTLPQNKIMTLML